MKLWVAGFVLLSSCTVQAEQPGFEIASIRPTSEYEPSAIATAPGKLAIRNQSLRACIQWAYDVQMFQISGPDWLDDERYNVAAKAVGPASADEMRVMLRALLAERFGLKLHREQKEFSVYLITTAKGDAKLHETGTKDSSKFMLSTGEGPTLFSEDKTGLIVQRATIAEMGQKLSRPLQRPVLDRTGLKGRYDLRIDVTAFLGMGGDDTGNKQEMDPFSVIFSGFQQQLGLKFDAAKETVDLLVVDTMNKTPTEN